jgi:adenine phosphoribosyltransferase
MVEPEESQAHSELIDGLIRRIPDFPRPGILFHDITTVLADADAWRITVDAAAGMARGFHPDVIVGIESRGFILGAALAYKLGIGFIPIRKPGKLPFQVHSVDYELEYGTDSLEIHIDAVGPGNRVLIVDDLLATGGTAGAAAELITACGADAVGLLVLIELLELQGRRVLPAGVEVAALLSY